MQPLLNKQPKIVIAGNYVKLNKYLCCRLFIKIELIPNHKSRKWGSSQSHWIPSLDVGGTSRLRQIGLGLGHTLSESLAPIPTCANYRQYRKSVVILINSTIIIIHRQRTNRKKCKLSGTLLLTVGDVHIRHTFACHLRVVSLGCCNNDNAL